jgi:DNA polymerase-3 subunit gamma/tau
MLIKGLRELELASNIKATADMVLVRLAHASNLPVPSDVIRALANARAQPELAPVPSLSPSELQGPSDQGSHLVEVKSSQVASTDIIPDPHVQIAKHQPALLISSFSEARALASDIDIRLAETLEQMARPVSFSEGYIEIELSNEARPDIATRFAEILTRATGQTWVVSIAGDSKGDTKPDLTSPERTSPAKSNESIPLVSQIKDQFPGAEVVAVRDLACTEEDDILILDEDKTSQSA